MKVVSITGMATALYSLLGCPDSIAGLGIFIAFYTGAAGCGLTMPWRFGRSILHLPARSADERRRTPGPTCLMCA